MRIFFRLIKWSILLGLIVWVLKQPGQVKIVWLNYEVETSAAFLIFVFCLGLYVCLWIYKSSRFIFDGPRLWRLKQQIARLQRGQNLITKGLAAIAGGDGLAGGEMAVSARKLLGETPLTLLLQAQAAQLAGDKSLARQIYFRLIHMPEGATLGYRGLIISALKEENLPEAENYISKLNQIDPELPWLGLIRFELSVKRKNWLAADEALADIAVSRSMETGKHRQYRAVVLTALAQVACNAGNYAKARQLAEKATRLHPNWLPAQLVLLEAFSLNKDKRAFLRHLEKFWAVNPHPQFAEFLSHVPGYENPLEQYKLLGKYSGPHSEKPETKQLLAEAALKADLWGAARKLLLELVAAGQANQAVFKILASLEKRETNDFSAATAWLAKAASATPNMRWLCTNCGAESLHWHGACPTCHSFNSIIWSNFMQGSQPKSTHLTETRILPSPEMEQ